MAVSKGWDPAWMDTAGGDTKFYNMEAMRIMACFPHGTRFEKREDVQMMMVLLPNNVSISISEHLLTLRMGNMLSGLQQAMWNEFIDRALDCPPGTKLDMGWLDEVRFNKGSNASGHSRGDFSDALNERDG